MYQRPSVLVIYREDHKFLLDSVIPKPGRIFESYDLILASQPWRARMSAEFKAQKVLAPLTRSLAAGRTPARDPVVRAKIPRSRSSRSSGRAKNPFQVDRHALLAALKKSSAATRATYTLTALPDDKAIFRYEMHTLPSEISGPHRHLDAVRRLERRHLREPDRGRAPRAGGDERRLPAGHAVRAAEVRRPVVQRRNFHRDAAQSLISRFESMNAKV